MLGVNRHFSPLSNSSLPLQSWHLQISVNLLFWCSHVDASHGGLGAILSQEQGEKIRPIAYASRGLRPAERNIDNYSSNYSSMKLELLAVKWSVTEKFHEYLLVNHFTILTDNNPSSHLQTAKLGAVEWASQLASLRSS